MRISKRLVFSLCTLLLFALVISQQQIATAKIVLESPDERPVGAILYHGAAGHYHTIQAGETLFGLALAYGVTVQQLLNTNSHIVNPNYIYAGNVIWIPPHSGGTGGGTPCDLSHYVSYGDSLFGIAYWYGTSVTQIMVANGIVDADYIYAGTWLYIPCG